MKLFAKLVLMGMTAGFGVGCGAEPLKINLFINDPCNQTVLSDNALGIADIEFKISAPDLSEDQTIIWSRNARSGELPDIPVTSQATITVSGREAQGEGSLGAVLAAIGVGLVDLSGQDGREELDLSVVFGRVGRFFESTDTNAATAGDLRCTALAAIRQGHTASLLGDGRVLMAGGRQVAGNKTVVLDSSELFDPKTGSYTAGPAMRWARAGHSASVLNSGQVLISGGFGLIDGSTDTWQVASIYDPESNTYLADIIPMKKARAHHSATVLSDGRVLLAGGVNDEAELDSTEIFDPTSRTFCDGPPLLGVKRSYHSAVLVSGNTVAIIGGRANGAALASVQFVTVLGCNQGSVAMGPNLTTPRIWALAGMIPGESALVVAGGFGTPVVAPEAGTGLSSIEVIRVNSQNLAQSSVVCEGLELKIGRGAAALAPLEGGFLVAGGVGTPGQVLDSAETMAFGDLTTCEFQSDWAEGGLTEPRAGMAATVLIGGDVLLSGGFTMRLGQAVSVGQSEIYVRAR